MLLPYPGVQEDEILFGPPLHTPSAAAHHWKIFGRHIPILVMPYVGALKTWLFAPIFAILGVSVWTVRLPALLIGAGSVLLNYHVLRRAAGDRAALLATALLATDPMLIMTTCFDWGPVAIQQFLQAGGLLLLVRFSRSASRADLAGCCFLLGLAVWNKGIFLWSAAGLGFAVAAVFGREARKYVSWRNGAAALAGFSLGSFPFLHFNATSGFASFAGNSGFDLGLLIPKIDILRATMDGSGLFGYMIAEPETGPHRTAQWALVLMAAAAAPVLAWRRISRLPLFCAAAMLPAWVLMAANPGAGGTVHHVILLWPFPQFLIAGAAVHISERLSRGRGPVLMLFGILFVLSNLLVLNAYRTQFARSGAEGPWTDATLALPAALRDYGDPVILTDWGLHNWLVMRNGAVDGILIGYDILRTEPGPDADDRFRRLLESPQATFVGFVEGKEVFAGTRLRLEAMAASNGYRKEVLRVIPDTHGRPAIELFRLLPAPGE